MKLNNLLKNVGVVEIKGNKHIDINGIYYDSKQLKAGGLFFAIKGSDANGLEFIDEAIERGAVCVVSEDDFITFKNVCKIRVRDARKACAVMASNFYQEPSSRMGVAGITGTNGKTTVLYLIEAILQQAGRSCGTIGTITYRIGERNIPAVNTTPSAIMLQMLLHEMHNAGISFCAMEVSSHSIHQHRIHGVRYDSAIFTNLSGEHLDYHKDIDEYFNVKKRLFDELGVDARAVTNADDDYGRKITADTKAKVITYGIKSKADITAEDIRYSIKGSCFKAKTPYGELDLKTHLIGEYNIYNILAAVSFALTKGIEPKEIEEAVSKFRGAPGRLQRIDRGQGFSVFIDYAHTDDALANVLAALRRLAKKRIITVFGCGGNRDRQKRPRMGRVAAELADFVIITSDNPRSEDPKGIIDDIVKGLPDGFKNYKISPDRKKAIGLSLAMAGDDDIVLIAGKGHEKYQILKETTVAFDDSKIASEMLEGETINEKV